MPFQFEKDHLVSEVVRKSLQVVSINDFNLEVLPLLDRLVDTSGSLLYHFSGEEGINASGGSFAFLGRHYQEHYREHDPIFASLLMRSPKIQQIAQLPEWKEYTNSPVYLEFARPNELNDFYHLILGGSQLESTGSNCLILGRAHSQKPFDRQDRQVLDQVHPFLDAFIRRQRRLSWGLNKLPVLNSLLEQGFPNVLALDCRGRLLWGSERILKLFGKMRKGYRGLPPELVSAARSLAKSLSPKGESKDVRFQVEVYHPKGHPLQFEAWLAYTRLEEVFFIFELIEKVPSVMFRKIALRFGLTPAETNVFRLLGNGLTDQQIADDLHVSITTVRTHVGNILAKLNVSSRVQAALMSHGILPQADDLMLN